MIAIIIIILILLALFWVNNDILVFDCMIHLFDHEKRIMLYYDTGKSRWVMSV